MLRERRKHANFKPNRRLDRKSSRGMIYENEELRLRTININAEVERGQSDIKKLRRENEQLRREIWSLRDEYDRLDKLLRRDKHATGTDGPHPADCDCARAGGGGGAAGGDDKEGGHAENEERCSCGQYLANEEAEEEEEEDEDDDDEDDNCNEDGICYECDSGDESCDDENCNCRGKSGDCDHELASVENNENQQKFLARCGNSSSSSGGGGGGGGGAAGSSTITNSKVRDSLHVNFDHLSIVSEENMTSSDGGNSINLNNNSNNDQNGSKNLLSAPLTRTAAGLNQAGKDNCMNPSLPATPCSPLLMDFQSLVPPLTHFENINYDDIKSPSASEFASKSSAAAKAKLSKLSSALHQPHPSAAIVYSSHHEDNDDHDDDDDDDEDDDNEYYDHDDPLSATSAALEGVVMQSPDSSNWIPNEQTVSFSTFRPPPTGAGPTTTTCPKPNSDVPSQFGANTVVRSEGEIVKISPMPRHFFSPLKSCAVAARLLPNSPDVYVQDVLASPSYRPATRLPIVEPIYAAVNKKPDSQTLSFSQSLPQIHQTSIHHSLSPSSTPAIFPRSPLLLAGTSAAGDRVTRSPTSFPVGGNLDDLLQDIGCISNGMEGLAIGLTNGAGGGAGGGDVDLEDGRCGPRPVVSGDGHVVAADGGGGGEGQLSDITPPPRLPEPMTLLPATLPYLDYRSSTAVIANTDSVVAAAATANNGALPGSSGSGTRQASDATVTSVVSKPISTATAVRRKLFGRKNNKESADKKNDVVSLKLTIPMPPTVTHLQQQSEKDALTREAAIADEPNTATIKRKARRVSLSFPRFSHAKKADFDDCGEKNTSSAENVATTTTAVVHKSSSAKNPLHRVSSGADISSISTSIGSPSTPTAGKHHHHHHHHYHKKGGGAAGSGGGGGAGSSSKGKMHRTSSDSQGIYSSPQHQHHCEMRRNSTVNEPMTTSLSERNSNSFASSRESSTSLSMRSQKSRRISDNSHAGGKIPWCGCWGNGCL